MPKGVTEETIENIIGKYREHSPAGLRTKCSKRPAEKTERPRLRLVSLLCYASSGGLFWISAGLFERFESLRTVEYSPIFPYYVYYYESK